jgi:hypothetical protein
MNPFAADIFCTLQQACVMMTADGSLVFFDHGIGRQARINLSAFIAVKVEPNA